MEEKSLRLGKLYGIGVGPGDPELITLKAIRILKEVESIFAPSSSSNEYSIALSIVDKHIGERPVIGLHFPMTRDKEVLKRAWLENAQKVLSCLREGKDCAFITLGDPLTYSTFCHLMRTVKELEPTVEVITVPGITSYHAAAAKLNFSIAEGDKGFYVVSGVNGGQHIKEALIKSDTVFVLKTYREFSNIKQVLEDLQLLEDAVLVKKLGMEDEEIKRGVEDLSEDAKLPYLTLLVVKNSSA